MISFLFYNRVTAGEWQMSIYADRLEAAGGNFELVDADTPRGVALANQYDLMARPAIVLAREDGAYIESWTQAEQFPPPNDLAVRSRV